MKKNFMLRRTTIRNIQTDDHFSLRTCAARALYQKTQQSRVWNSRLDDDVYCTTSLQGISSGGGSRWGAMARACMCVKTDRYRSVCTNYGSECSGDVVDLFILHPCNPNRHKRYPHYTVWIVNSLNLSLKSILITLIYKTLSASGGHCPQTIYRGFAPEPHWGTSVSLSDPAECWNNSMSNWNLYWLEKRNWQTSVRLTGVTVQGLIDLEVHVLIT